MGSYTSVLTNLLYGWYHITLENPEYFVAIFCLSGILIGWLMYSYQRSQLALQKRYFAEQSSARELEFSINKRHLEEVEQNLQLLKEELQNKEVHIHEMTTAGQANQALATRAIDLEAQINQRNQDMSQLMQLLQTEYGIGQQMTTGQELDFDDLWQQQVELTTHLAQGLQHNQKQLVELQIAQQELSQLQQAQQMLTAQLSERQVMVQQLQATIAGQSNQISQLTADNQAHQNIHRAEKQQLQETIAEQSDQISQLTLDIQTQKDFQQGEKQQLQATIAEQSHQISQLTLNIQTQKDSLQANIEKNKAESSAKSSTEAKIASVAPQVVAVEPLVVTEPVKVVETVVTKEEEVAVKKIDTAPADFIYPEETSWFKPLKKKLGDLFVKNKAAPAVQDAGISQEAVPALDNTKVADAEPEIETLEQGPEVEPIAEVVASEPIVEQVASVAVAAAKESEMLEVVEEPSKQTVVEKWSWFNPIKAKFKALTTKAKTDPAEQVVIEVSPAESVVNEIEETVAKLESQTEIGTEDKVIEVQAQAEERLFVKEPEISIANESDTEEVASVLVDEPVAAIVAASTATEGYSITGKKSWFSPIRAQLKALSGSSKAVVEEPIYLEEVPRVDEVESIVNEVVPDVALEEAITDIQATNGDVDVIQVDEIISDATQAMPGLEQTAEAPTVIGAEDKVGVAEEQEVYSSAKKSWVTALISPLKTLTGQTQSVYQEPIYLDEVVATTLPESSDVAVQSVVAIDTLVEENAEVIAVASTSAEVLQVDAVDQLAVAESTNVMDDEVEHEPAEGVLESEEDVVIPTVETMIVSDSVSPVVSVDAEVTGTLQDESVATAESVESQVFETIAADNKAADVAIDAETEEDAVARQSAALDLRQPPVTESVYMDYVRTLDDIAVSVKPTASSIEAINVSAIGPIVSDAVDEAVADGGIAAEEDVVEAQASVVEDDVVLDDLSTAPDLSQPPVVESVYMDYVRTLDDIAVSVKPTASSMEVINVSAIRPVVSDAVDEAVADGDIEVEEDVVEVQASTVEDDVVLDDLSTALDLDEAPVSEPIYMDYVRTLDDIAVSTDSKNVKMPQVETDVAVASEVSDVINTNVLVDVDHTSISVEKNAWFSRWFGLGAARSSEATHIEEIKTSEMEADIIDTGNQQADSIYMDYVRSLEDIAISAKSGLTQQTSETQVSRENLAINDVGASAVNGQVVLAHTSWLGIVKDFIGLDKRSYTEAIYMEHARSIEEVADIAVVESQPDETEEVPQRRQSWFSSLQALIKP